MAPLTSIYIGESLIEYKPKTRFLGVTVDQNLSWIPHLQEVVKSFAKKLSLLKKSRFLPSHMCESFYLKVIQPSITYAMPVWGSVSQTELFKSLERQHSVLPGSYLVFRRTGQQFLKRLCFHKTCINIILILAYAIRYCPHKSYSYLWFLKLRTILFLRHSVR